MLERRFHPGLDPEQAVAITNEFLQPDYAYSFESYWALFAESENSNDIELSPQRAEIIVHGTEFDDGVYKQAGHIQIDFGLDTPFLYENVDLTQANENRVQSTSRS